MTLIKDLPIYHITNDKTVNVNIIPPKLTMMMMMMEVGDNDVLFFAAP